MTLRNPVVLIILDGFGINPETENNAIALARTPKLDDYFARYPYTTLQASGRAAGLPEGQMGNSEVGHMTIGAGAILHQDLVRIDDAITDKSFYSNPVLKQSIVEARKQNRPVHLVGLVSDGGVHSHIHHLIALIQMCKENEVVPVLHMITDGRDTPPKSALNYLSQLRIPLEQARGYISTVSGRFYAMDRDKRWERTQKAWRAMCFGEGLKAKSAIAAIEQSYARDETDEFIQPTVIEDTPTIENGDQIIFFNFRNDRARQLTYVFAGEDFIPFDRNDFEPHRVTCLTEYDPQLDLPVAFEPEFPKETLGSVVAKNKIKQFHCAETEKYAHVTFFTNGGREEPYHGEDREMIPSPAVETYDLKPEMSAPAVADAVIDAINGREYGLIVVNFANGDMVGHTAVREAVIKAVEVLDAEVGRVLDCAVENGFSVLLTADHGNCDEMVDKKTGEPHTQHTTNPVPCIVIDKENWHLKSDGGLSNIAPTILQLMGLKVPDCMTATSLLQKI
jgi:2,3-bisphosphoglycerate-independent phosphoglycerate mutase